MQLVSNYSLNIDSKSNYPQKKFENSNSFVDKNVQPISPIKSYYAHFKKDNAYQVYFGGVYHSDLLNELAKLTTKKVSLISEIVDNEINIAHIRKKQFELCEELRKTEESITVKSNLHGEQTIKEPDKEPLSGLNNKIGGHLKEKDKIRTIFIRKLIKSKEDPAFPIPNCIILSGQPADTKTFFKGIEEETQDLAKVVDISNMNIDKNFNTEIEKLLTEAKNRYIKEGKRTIIFTDNAERILSINKTDSKILGIALDDNDKNILEANGNNIEKISYFKSLFDNVADIPNLNNPYMDQQSATTFIMATKNPHLIHPDLITRSGKVTLLPIELASDKNLEDVIKFHLNKISRILISLRKLKEDANYEKEVDQFRGISNEAKENIKKIIRRVSINDLQINFNDIPYEKIIKVLNPNETEGAFSNAKIELITQDVIDNYLEIGYGKEDIRISIIRALLNAHRDITPKEYKKYCEIRKIFEQEEIDLDSLESLLKQKEMGILSEKKANLLQYHIERIKAEFESLNNQANSGTLNEQQVSRKKELEELLLKINVK